MDVGPGTPLMCVKSYQCICGECVDEGALYTCDGVEDPPPLMIGLFCAVCGDREHKTILLMGKGHDFCPTLFGPLGDPEEEIIETDEPQSIKRREDNDPYLDDLPVSPRVKEPSNV